MAELVQLYKCEKNNLPEVLDPDSIYYTTDAKSIYIQGTEFISRETLENEVIKNIAKCDYKNYIGITPSNPDYNSILFIDDGSGMIYKGKLYVNNSFWIEVVNDEPEEKAENTVYFIKE